MQYDVLSDILVKSENTDWLFNDERGVYTYKHDLNLRIQRKKIDKSFDTFIGEDWANCHPDPTAYKEYFEIYYGSSFVLEKMLVTVDGFRATLPLPNINSKKISYSDYRFAKIVDHQNSLEEYISRSSLEVEND